MALDTVYRRNPDVRERRVLDEMLLVPIRGELNDMQNIFALNPVGQHIWAQLDGEHDLAAVRDSIVVKFNVSLAQAEADLLEFIAQLTAAGLASEVS